MVGGGVISERIPKGLSRVVDLMDKAIQSKEEEMSEKIPSLYNLTAEARDILALLDWEEEAEVRANLAVWFAGNQELMAKKIDAVVAVTRGLEALAKARREEARHITEMARAAENGAERLKEMAKLCAGELNIKKFEGITRTITISDGGFAIDVISEADVPMAFKEQVVSYKVDKNGIKEYIERTEEEVPGIQSRPIVRVLMR
jgi:hypothetical protein